MKKHFYLLMLLSYFSYSQVGVGTTMPNSTLEIVAANPTGSSTSVDGILIPRVDRQRAQNMSGTQTSTMIYVNSIATGTETGTAVNINSTGFYFYNGSVWQKIATGTNNDWSLTGNTGTSPGTNFIGTTDPFDFRIKTGNTDRWNISNANSGQLQSYSLGTATTPSYSFQGDQNTGIYSSGADALDFSTGGISRVGINASGNVGIGTTPTASTILDMSSVTNKAIEAPNVALTATTTATLTAPATGALVYNTSTAGSGLTAVYPGYYYWDGSTWISLATGGQNSSSYFTTAGTTIGPATGLTYVSGFPVTVNVPANSSVVLSCDIGVQTTSALTTGFSSVDITLIVDGFLLTDGGYQRTMTLNNGGVTGAIQYASMSQSVTLAAGNHTFGIAAAGVGIGSNATVGGNGSSVLQGELTVTIIKK